MKIGIDAKWFFHGPPSGKNAVRNLIENIIKSNHENDIYILLDKREKKEIFPFSNPTIHLVYVWGDNNLLANIFVVPWVIRNLKLDVVIFQNFVPIISNFKSIAFIYDVIFLSHPQYFTIQERIYLYSIKYLSRYATRICTISCAERDRITAYTNISKGNIDVIYMGVSSSFLPKNNYTEIEIHAIRERYHLPELFLLYVGRINIRKNILNLLKAIPLLEDKNIKLIIVGSTDITMLNISKICQTLNIEERVCFTGFVMDEDLPIIYSLAKVFCFLSYEEGFGLPPLESMAAGVPVVISNRSSLPEVCGEAGNYVQAEEPRSTALMIDRLLLNDELYDEQRKRGLHRAKLFRWEQSAENLLKCVYSAKENQ